MIKNASNNLDNITKSEKNPNHNDLTFLETIGACAILTTIMFSYGHYHWEKRYDEANRIPTIEKVQQGFINPSKLEISVEDLDKNGISETSFKVGSKKYALREVDGKPVISEYSVKPAIPPKIIIK